MIRRDDDTPIALILLLSFAFVGFIKSGGSVSEPIEPPEISQGFFEDVRIKINFNSHQLLSEFIQTGKFSKDRVGVDMTAVESIRCLPGRLVFSPPIRVNYDGPGPLNAGTTIKEIRFGTDGEILVDVVNSPIDLVIEEEE